MKEKSKPYGANNFIAAATVILSGAGLFWGNSISGSYGWLLWIAPAPVLLLCFYSSPMKAFFFGFTAFFIGWLSWLAYLLQLMPLPPAIIIIALLSLSAALILLLAGKIVRTHQNLMALFALPALYTAFEFLMGQFSHDGTAASMAYTQGNYLAIVQIASITGLYGITFLLMLTCSCLAVCVYYWHNRKLVATSAGVTFLILATTYGYGISRKVEKARPTLKVGLVVLDEPVHLFPAAPSLAEETDVAKLYAAQLPALASEGVEWAVFPEEIVNVTPQIQDSVLHVFITAAKASKIGVTTGAKIHRNGVYRNVAWIISAEGTLLDEYTKVHHVTGWEDDFEPGSSTTQLSVNGYTIGVAICKDLDYFSWMRKYNKADVLLVPAWDFTVDGWLHSRMAIMRSVESGYSMVRAARKGRLTISDFTGTVLYEANSESEKLAVLTGIVPVQRTPTFYSKWGNWFGWTTVSALLILVLFSFRKKFTYAMA